MKVRAQAAAVGIAVCLLTGCSMFKSESEETGSNGSKSSNTKQQGDMKAQSQQKPSIIDQELQKQFQIYKEIIDYQLKQQQKVQQQSEKRYKELKEESEKPTVLETGKPGKRKTGSQTTSNDTGKNKEKQGNLSDTNMSSNK